MGGVCHDEASGQIGDMRDSIRALYAVVAASILATAESRAGGVPPTASFTAFPTNGVQLLVVTLTDTSTGPILGLSWDFGDSTTTNTTAGASFAHTYAAGSYTVTLTASGPFGVSTITEANLITVIPEPSTFGLVGVSLLSAMVMRRRRYNKWSASFPGKVPG